MTIRSSLAVKSTPAQVKTPTEHCSISPLIAPQILSLPYFVRQLQVSFHGERFVNQEDGHRIGVNLLKGETLSGNVPPADIVPSGDHELQPFSMSEHPEHRELVVRNVWLHIHEGPPNRQFKLKLTILRDGEVIFMQEFDFMTDENGDAWIIISIDTVYLNADLTDVCDGCDLEQEEIECPLSGCDEDFIVWVSPAELVLSALKVHDSLPCLGRVGLVTYR